MTLTLTLIPTFEFDGADAAVHASSALTQAVFLNDALRSILALYAHRASKDGVPASPKIIIVGHSVGGMTARTAVTLDNHPRCAVSDIVMLSCPSQRAAFSPDASMEALYRTVNRAWTQGYFNESAVCVRARAQEAEAAEWAGRAGGGSGADTGATSAGDDAASSATRVQGSWKCPACVPSIRLLSVAGGDIDSLVPTFLTSLDSLLPWPRNLTLEAAAAPKVFRILGVYDDVMRGVWSVADAVYGAAAGLGAIFAGGSSTGSDAGGGTNGTTTEAAAAVRLARNGTYGQLYSISQAEWDKDVLRYAEPAALSLRTSQLQATGFPIDHKAILWCRQLVAAVTTGVRALSKQEGAGALHGLIPLSRPGLEDTDPAARGVSGWAFADLVPPIAAFVRRNESSAAFRAAEVDELVYMASKLPLGYPQALAVTIVSQHWICLAVTYILTALLVISTPLRRQITGFSPAAHCPGGSGVRKARRGGPSPGPLASSSGDNELGRGALDWSLLQWQAHSHCEELICLLPVLRGLLNEATLSIISPLSLLVTLAGKLALDYYSSPLAVVRASSVYSLLARWLCAYCVTLLLRLALLTVVYGLRAALHAAGQAGLWGLRCTVLSVAARRATKGGRRSLQAWLDAVGLTVQRQGRVYAASHALWLAGLLLALAYFTRARLSSGLFPLWSCLVSLLTLGLSLSVGLLALLVLLDPSSDHHATSLGLLYLPTVLLCYPSARFSYALLAEPAEGFAAALELFGLFGPERVNTCLCLAGVAGHLALARTSG